MALEKLYKKMCRAILLLTGAFYGRTRNDVKPLRNPGPENHKY